MTEPFWSTVILVITPVYDHWDLTWNLLESAQELFMMLCICVDLVTDIAIKNNSLCRFAVYKLNESINDWLSLIDVLTNISPICNMQYF